MTEGGITGYPLPARKPERNSSSAGTAEKGESKVRLIKMFGLAAVAAVAAMAFIGASSASATSTALCKVHQEPCAEANLVKSIHMVANDPILETSIATVLCASSLAVASVGALAAPQKATVTTLTWTACKTVGSATENCTVTNLKLPVFDVLKTALNLGTAVALNPEVLVKCTNIPIFGELHCVYGGPAVEGFSVEGALHLAGTGHGMFTATKLTVPKVKGFFCPETSKWTALYEPLEHIYIVG